MCAINGVINWSGIDQIDIDKVSKSLLKMEYRGPDFSNSQWDNYCVLGHNRLAIIDLNPRSNQPMKTPDGRYSIVFNGELYNYKELKAILESSGKIFYSSSDTEVLLEGFTVFGKEVVHHIRGMFAFVIWDAVEKKAFAARDCFGEKPFYYFHNSSFGFASNLSGIVALSSDNLTINKQALYELLSQQYIDTNSCIYNGIKKLPPGCYIEISSSECKTTTYWNPDYKNKIEGNFELHKNKLHHLLQEVVGEQLVADVPVGLFLSGGVDSALITALASKQKKDITAITMSVPDNKSMDEADAAAFVAKKLKINHQIISLDKNCVKNLPHILKTIEPLADASLIPTMAIAEAAKKEFKVMLSGDGGDEVFGGYNRPLHYNKYHYIGNNFSQSIVSTLIKNSDRSPYQYFHAKLNDVRIFKWGGLESYYNLKSLPTKQSRSLLKSDVDFINAQNAIYKEAALHVNNEVDKLLYVGVKSNLVDDFLLKMDSANMFYSVESRAPFLDHRILDYTSKLNINQLMPNGIDKEILKNIGCEYLPPEFFKRPKTGFSIPYYDYLKTSWGTLLEGFLKEGISDEMGLIDASVASDLLKKYRINPNFKLGKLIYSILVFEIWLRVFHFERNPNDIKMDSIK